MSANIEYFQRISKIMKKNKIEVKFVVIKKIFHFLLKLWLLKWKFSIFLIDKKDISYVRMKWISLGIFCILFHTKEGQKFLGYNLEFDPCKFSSFLHFFSRLYEDREVTWTINFVPNTSFHSMENSRFLWKIQYLASALF